MKKLWVLIGCFFFFILASSGQGQTNKAGLLFHIMPGGKHGYIDSTGKVVIKPQFDGGSKYFSEGLASVEVESKWSYIDTTGVLVIKPQFDEAEDFGNGLAPVQINSKWGYIDKKGKIVIQMQYNRAESFYGGLALVMVDSKLAYIDTQGKFVWGPVD
jgi:hypothetical protein